MAIRSLDYVAQKPRVGLQLVRRPAGIRERRKQNYQLAVEDAHLEEDEEDEDVYASMPMVEYFKEQSLASCARRSATYSSVRISSFPIMKMNS